MPILCSTEFRTKSSELKYVTQSKASLQCVYLVLQVTDDTHNLFKGWDFSIKHILHGGIVRPKGIESIGRREQFQGGRDSFWIFCSCPWVEFHFEIDYLLQKIQMNKCFLLHGTDRHTVQIIIMSGIPLRHQQMFRSVCFMM